VPELDTASSLEMLLARSCDFLEHVARVMQHLGRLIQGSEKVCQMRFEAQVFGSPGQALL